jgi:Domain of unknown function (DUF3850)
MDTHKVKSWCYLYSAAIAGYKTHDFRDMTERDYKVGDHMHFQEFDQTTGKYTGREALFQITYITDNRTPCAMSSCALEKKYGVLSIKFLEILKDKLCCTYTKPPFKKCPKCGGRDSY